MPLAEPPVTPRSAPVERTTGRHRRLHTPHSGGVRTDIQGLRAIAVSAVVLYHLFPGRLTGGFVGVDVFFVISGFLITSHLIAHPPDRVANLVDFWSRRIRRLLPAALFVLLVTLGLSRLVAPSTQWENTALQVRAAALYVVNWRLADDSVDYLAANQTASPVQHFWSLSVEEQFYLFWPVLLLVAVLVARLVRRRPLPFAAVAAAAVVAASLWYSVHETHSASGRAYFVTPTRVWELGVGGLLAMAIAPRAFGRDRSTGRTGPDGLRLLLVWGGLAAMAWTFLSYDGHTPFPSWRAAVPVLGCAAVIAARDPRGPLAPGRLLALRPVQWLGDVSYSMYLWHWPLIVLLPQATGHRLTDLEKVSIVVVALLLSALTKRFVEDPFRRPRVARLRLVPFAAAAAGMAVVLVAAGAQVHEVQAHETAQREALSKLVNSGDRCFGAPALQAGATACPVTTSGTLHPDPQTAKNDLPAGFNRNASEKGCFALMPAYKPVVCTFGSDHPTQRIALVGNSHAYEFVPALKELAAKNHWQVTTYIAQRCVYSDPADVPAKVANAQKSCFAWVHWATAQITSHTYDLVVTANRSTYPGATPVYSPDAKEYQQGFTTVLTKLRVAREKVLVFRDTPSPSREIPDCLAAHTTDYPACDGSRSTWLVPDPAVAAAQALHDPDVTVTDFTKYLCLPVRCPAVIGSVPVYFDNSHMTATFAATLAPYVGVAMTGALRS